MANILYLGSPTSYVTQNDISVFTEAGYNPLLLNVYATSSKSREDFLDYKKALNLPDITLLKALRERMGGTLSYIMFERLKWKTKVFQQIIEDNTINLIYASWGSNMIPIVKILQKMKQKVPILYNFLSYPQNVYKWRVLLENRYCRRAIKKLDGRIHATKSMYHYMQSCFNLNEHGFDIIMTPFFSRRYSYRERLPLLSENDGEPHLIYIGPVSFHRLWDDVRREIYRITEEKIHLHMAKPNLRIKANPYLHFFEHFPLKQLINGSLATFMTQFDACIILFNFKVCSCMDRFHTSYPSRFLFALNAGIPVVMPRGYLSTCEEFVSQHEIGFAYNNLAQLKKMLSNNHFMLRYQKKAIQKSFDFTYEKNLYKINQLMKRVIL
jgi:hypothetical protein